MVAFLYPLMLLLVVWAITGVGTLGNVEVLPSDWVFLKRLLWSLILPGAPWLAQLATKKMLRRKLSERWAWFVAGAVAVAVATALVSLLDWLVERLRSRGYPVVSIALLWWAALSLCLLAAAAWVPARVPAAQLHANGLTFLYMVFLSLLPLLNAVSDWVSVGATRAFIRRYLAGQMPVWLLLLLDGLIAVAMMLVLYLGVVGLFLALQHWGWQVDARALVAAFRDHPLSPQASWLTAMAVTNILPTLLHLSIAVVGLLTGRLHRERTNLSDAFQRLQPSLIVLPGIQQAAADGHGLARSDAIAMVNYLYVRRSLAGRCPGAESDHRPLAAIDLWAGMVAGVAVNA